MEYSQKIEALLSELKRVRRELHQIAELSGQEHKTAAYILEYLKSLGHKGKTIDTGVYVDIKGRGGNKKIAFRCDIDALPIKENTNTEYKCTNGCMHACGHDGHIAIVLALAKLLSQNPPLQDVRLIFQYGEEGLGGAQKMIDAGVLKGVDEIYAVHLSPEIDKGMLSTCFGTMFAGTVEFDIVSKGKASHCAMPSKGIDVIKTLTHFLSNKDALNEKYKNNTLFHVGCIKSGTARNIVSNNLEVACSLRFFDTDAQEDIIMRLARLLNEADNLYKTDTQIKVKEVYQPLANSAEAVYKVKELYPDILECEAKYTAEDFGAYTQVIKGCMLWLGIKDDKHSSPLHSDTFDFDEAALLSGLELFNIIANT